MKVEKWISTLLAAALSVNVLISLFSIRSGLQELKTIAQDNCIKNTDSAKRLIKLLAGQAMLQNKYLEVKSELTSRAGLLQKQITGIEDFLKSYRKEGLLSNNPTEGPAPSADNPVLSELYAEGKAVFKEGRYSDSLEIYKKLLVLDGSSAEAVVFYNASLFYLNPGDESNYFVIKKSLEAVAADKKCGQDLQQIIRDIFAAISREEGGY